MAFKKQPTPINMQNYGKYKGSTFEQILAIDPDYLAWLLQTTDPADTKNQGKYAKQNQERIAYLKKLLETVSDERMPGDEPPIDIGDDLPPHIPDTTAKPVSNGDLTMPVLKNTLKCIVAVEEKVNKILTILEKKHDIPGDDYIQ